MSTRIILASGSPRRQELLAAAGVQFEVIVPDVDESIASGLLVDEQAIALAARKAGVVDDNDAVVIAADTLVVVDDMILGKPADAPEAIGMLRLLSGRTHAVTTGVCIRHRGETFSFAETTHVTFDTLSDADITHYVNTFEPYDKAGAYAIQEWIGLVGISRIDGDYNNVVGLPVNRLLHALSGMTAPADR